MIKFYFNDNLFATTTDIETFYYLYHKNYPFNVRGTMYQPNSLTGLVKAETEIGSDAELFFKYM